MKYMLLIYDNDATREAFFAGDATSEQLMAQVHSVMREITDSGELVSTDALAHPSQSKVVGPRDGVAGGVPVATDGPFAESKEHLGGFWIIEVPDLDAALKWAAEGSAACAGKVEVRPFQDEPA